MAIVTTILDAMRAIRAVQVGIAITDPEPRRVKVAYLTQPHQAETLVANLPCFTNNWDFLAETRHGNLRELTYLVHMQLHVAQATNGDNSRSAEIATAFFDPILTAFGQVNSAGLGGITMRGLVAGTVVPTVTFTNIRGGSPTMGRLDPPGTIGLDLILELTVSEAFAYS